VNQFTLVFAASADGKGPAVWRPGQVHRAEWRSWFGPLRSDW